MTQLLNYTFMGSATIPLGTVLRMKEGFVRCKSPDYIVGYINQPNTITMLGNFEDGEAQGSIRPSTMLRIHATLDPIATAPTKSPPDFPRNECREVLSRVQQFSERYLEGTNCSVLWPDIHGVGYLTSRFLTAQNPPKIRAMTLEACAHYVSLIPSKRTWSSLKRLNMSQHLVLTSTQTLDILAGDAAEHAVLLANYFMYLGKKNPAEYNAHVCLVLGCSIPEGNTVWVMRKSSSGDVLLWDATSGCAFSREDDSIPLQKVYCLVSKENIYANLHQETKPHSLDFDLTNPKKWAPLHNTDDQVPLDITTIQEETLTYSPPNHSYARELQDELKETIKSAMREWRRTTTSFRTDTVPKLVSILERLEQAKLGSKDVVVPLEVLSKTRNVSGFALHFAYTNTDDVLRSVKATEIHENRNPHVEFSLGIRVFAYPGGALSVWIFLSTMT
ncbi:hypothetical protein ACHAWO_012386 [Cyclotella atomus]|uniref:Uncharacterized protein n=1 Tax=Cyclotella atomus TaxID=382360 RepID=A0ABD3N221_9STRA